MFAHIAGCSCAISNGRLSILANWKLDITKICDIKPESFSPKPKVCSSLLFFSPKENFVKIKDTLNRKQDLIHILKIAFDIEVDPNLLLEQADVIQSSCNDIFEILSND